MHSTPLITTMAVALGLALVFGFLAMKCRLPALLGYLLAGVLIGPFTPGFVANSALASELAEIGVILLMFGVGLHFSLKDLLQVRKIAVPGAVIQIVVATGLGLGLALYWGWSFGAALVLGLSLSVASTVVLLRALDDQGNLQSMNGRIAVGWLIVEDLLMILVLVLLPPLALLLGGEGQNSSTENLLYTVVITLMKVSLFIAVMLVLGKKLFPKILWHVASVGSRELFTLCVVAAALSIAYLSTLLFGVSMALGAFFAGMMLQESEFSHRATQESLPFREAFSVLFFVAVGMLFDPSIILRQPVQVLSVVGIIVVGKTLAAGLLVLAFRYPLSTALTVSASLAQIGEFSFILASLGVSLKLMPQEGQSLILAGAIISIGINPLLFKLAKPVQRSLEANQRFQNLLPQGIDPLSELPISTHEKFLTGQVVLVGYGRVGRQLVALLNQIEIPVVIAEQNRELVERLRSRGVSAVFGNAAEPTVLVQAHIANAGMLVIATKDAIDVKKMIDIARTLNPRIEIVIRSHNEDDLELLRTSGTEKVFLGEEVLAQSMVSHIRERFGK